MLSGDARIADAQPDRTEVIQALSWPRLNFWLVSGGYLMVS